jgi:hypothetical protein
VFAIGTTSLYVRYNSISLRSGAMISFGSVTNWMSSGVGQGRFLSKSYRLCSSKPSCLISHFPGADQSDDGIVFGSCTFISFSQQVSVPSPGFVERASVPQTSHLYRFPSLLGIVNASLLFEFHGLITAGNGPVSTTGDDHFRSAFSAYISFSDCVRHWYNLLICSL